MGPSVFRERERESLGSRDGLAEVSSGTALRILRRITPDPSTMSALQAMQDLDFHGELIPTSYVRSLVPFIGREAMCHYDETASHLLWLVNTRRRTLEPICLVHDLLLLCQCVHLREAVTFYIDHSGARRPVMAIRNLPHRTSLVCLLNWLYTNDAQMLENSLRRTSIDFMEGFARNVQFLGIVSQEMEAVFKNILEDLGS